MVRGVTGYSIAGGLGLAVMVGAIAHAQLPQVEAAPTPAALPVAVAPVIKDADRRAALDARVARMLSDGKGARLADPPKSPVKARPQPSSPRPSATHPAPTAAASSVRPEPASTIAPPAYRPSAAPITRGRGYTPPRLDLTTPPVAPTSDLECLTQAVYYEARNESEAGQAAVAEVVLNRSRHRAYPKRICEVVYQRNSRTCQFTFTCDGSIGRRPVSPVAWARAERIAREVYEGRSTAQLPKNSVNYHANYVRPRWGATLSRVRQIGAHIFYGAPLNGGSTPGAEFTPAPEPQRTLFVRNEALDRAYALLTAQPEQSTPGS